MRHLSRALVALALFVLGSAATAEALSVRDVIQLSKSGVSDQVLLALIDVDHRVYTLDNAAITEMKDAGVSEKVVIAMIRSGRPAASTSQPLSPPETSAVGELQRDQPSEMQVAAPAANEPQVIVIDHHDAASDPGTVPVGVAVPYPVFLSGPARHSRRVDGQRVQAVQVPSYPLGTLAPQQPYLTNTRGTSYPMPNYPLGTLAGPQPFLSVPQPMMRAPICEPRLSAGGATTVVCR